MCTPITWRESKNAVQQDSEAVICGFPTKTICQESATAGFKAKSLVTTLANFF